MKKIIFIRHAKSSWNSGATRDFDRPLNKRGKRDAPFMAKILSEKIDSVDGIVLSPSKRTTATAQSFIKAFDIKENQFYDEPSLYHGSLGNILDVVRALPASWNNVILFGHNPGMTYVAEYFGMEDVENVPTCGIIMVESELKDWAMVNQDNSKIIGFEFPKKYSIGS